MLVALLERNSSRTSLALSRSRFLALSRSLDGVVARKLIMGGAAVGQATALPIAQSPQRAALTAGSLWPLPFLRLVPEAMIRRATLPLVVRYSVLGAHQGPLRCSRGTQVCHLKKIQKRLTVLRSSVQYKCRNTQTLATHASNLEDWMSDRAEVNGPSVIGTGPLR
jgi:hypothetical protein